VALSVLSRENAWPKIVLYDSFVRKAPKGIFLAIRGELSPGGLLDHFFMTIILLLIEARPQILQVSAENRHNFYCHHGEVMVPVVNLINSVLPVVLGILFICSSFGYRFAFLIDDSASVI
jgi:hypothetical protein